MSQTIKDVPLEHLHPDEDSVVVQQYNSTETEAGIQLPEIAQVIVQVAKKVGKNVKHVQKGDIVLIRNTSAVTFVPEVKGPCAIVPAAAIAGVIRGYDWRSKLMDEVRRAPKLVS